MRLTDKWRINIPLLLGLPDAGFDDADIDANGSVYIGDGGSGKIYKMHPDGTGADVCIIPRTSDSSMSLAVMPDSTFYVADAAISMIMRYDENGSLTGDFGVPGIISLCAGPDGILYVLAKSGYDEQINSYDGLGSLIDSIPISVDSIHHDPALVNMDSDSQGALYLSFGTPPYKIWRVNPDGSTSEPRGRLMEYPEDAVLVADMAVDKKSDILWALLACRDFGRQTIDAFSPDGDLLETLAIPRSDYLYGVICAHDDSIYLMDTGAGPDSGNLVCLHVER